MVTNRGIVMTFPEDYLPPELEKDVEQFTLPLPKSINSLTYDVFMLIVDIHPGTVNLVQDEVFDRIVRAQQRV